MLSDKKERDDLLKKDVELKEEYRLRKEMILKAKNCDECCEAVYRPKKLIKVSKYLGLSSEYKLEDDNETDI